MFELSMQTYGETRKTLKGAWSTTEEADAVAETLREKGQDVEVKPVAEVTEA